MTSETSVTVREPIAAEIMCEAVEASCICELDDGHDGPHECDCGGSWDYTTDGKFVPVKFPGGRL